MTPDPDNPLPGPWIDPDRSDPEPWKSAEGIVKFFEFVVRIPAMSHRAFHLYWQKHHSPNVMNVTPFAQFMRKYNSGHVFPASTPGIPARYRQDTPFEGAAEVWLNRWQEVGDWLGHPLYAALIQPDEPRFIAQDGRTAIMVAREERLYEPDRDMHEARYVKTYLILSRARGVAREEFHAGISAHGKAIVADDTLRRHLAKAVISHRLPDPCPIGGLPETDIDAVLELWFANRAVLAAYFAEPAHKALAAREARLVDPDKSRALVCRMRVVHDEFSFQPSVTQPLPFSWED